MLSRRFAVNLFSLALGAFAGIGVAWSLSSRHQETSAAALAEDLDEMAFAAQSTAVPARAVDETPRGADGTPLALETATFALG